MKKWKKNISVLLATCMIFAGALPTFAEFASIEPDGFETLEELHADEAQGVESAEADEAELEGTDSNVIEEINEDNRTPEEKVSVEKEPVETSASNGKMLGSADDLIYWGIDDKKTLHISSTDTGLGNGGSFDSEKTSVPWKGKTYDKVSIDKKIKPKKTYRWFSESQATEISNISNLDTSNVTDMAAMFLGCDSLTTLDVSSFDTGKVTNMRNMFSRCNSLTTLDLSNFDTGNVTNMGAMFSSCTSLTTLDLSNFDTSNVTDMGSMFSSCSSLTTLDLSGFDTSNVTDMNYMFFSCASLTTLDLSGFDTGKVTDMSAMFMSCQSLKALDLSGFDTSNVTDMIRMFLGCASLTTLDLSSFDTSNVTTMASMFSDCTSLTTLDVSGFDTSNVTDMYAMFSSCDSLTTLDLSGFDTGKVTDMSFMFYNCRNLTTLNLSGFDTGNVEDASRIFGDCYRLSDIAVGEKWTLENVFPNLSRITPESHTVAEIKAFYEEHPFSTTEKDTFAKAAVPQEEISGVLSDHSKQNALNMLNFMRYTAGIAADVLYNDGYDIRCGAGAVILSRNNVLSHYPDKPKGMSNYYYNIGVLGTSTSNIAMGYANAAATVVAYMEDGDVSNIERVGHRRWCLNPSMGKTAFGECGSFYTMAAHDMSRTDTVDYDYVIWPASVAPIEYSKGPFSIMLNTDNYTVPDKETVKAIIKCNGKTYTLDKNSRDTSANGAYFSINTDSIGSGYAVIFQAPYTFKAGDTAEVTIEGLEDRHLGRVDLTYTVEFFSMENEKTSGNTSGGNSNRNSGESSGGYSGGGGSSSGGSGGGGATRGPGAKITTVTGAPTFSKNWVADAAGVWRIRDKDGNYVTSAWLCDDAVPANGQNVWYLMNTDGTMLAVGLVQDNTGNYYSLEMNHNGYYGMLRYTNGTYDGIYMEFSQKHDGTFGAITNQSAIDALKARYGVTRFGIGNDRCVYTKSFE